MSNIKWEDGAVCFAYGGQMLAVGESLRDSKDYTASWGVALEAGDFQLNGIREGDYIEASELDTEQKYNNAVEVFELFGFELYEKAGGFRNLEFGSGVFVSDSGVMNFYGGRNEGRMLTYSQLMAIGKLKRAIELTKDIGGNKMSKFNVGDTVRRISGKDCFDMKKGGVYTVTSTGPYRVYVDGSKVRSFLEEHFELAEDTSEHHKHHDLIIAWAKGAEIESKNKVYDWVRVHNPQWYIDCEYRIKPSNPEKEKIEQLISDMEQQLTDAKKRLEEIASE